MIRLCPAKINLGLQVIRKRADGFHDLDTVFYPIPWNDVLEVEVANQNELLLYGREIPGAPENNLCLLAVERLQALCDIPAVRISLLKNIPIGAGLGGGSSDATNTLILLNDFFNLDLSKEKLLSLAGDLGSDCPFFVNAVPTRARGTGNAFSETDCSLTGNYILAINPGIHISTAWAYSHINPQKPELDLGSIISNRADWSRGLVNDFQKSAEKEYPIIASIVADFYSDGAFYAAMSGSGSTVFGLFETEAELGKYIKKYSIDISNIFSSKLV